MDQPLILESMLKSKLINYLIIDYDKFEDNTCILTLLNRVVIQILSCTSDEFRLRTKLLFELKLLKIFSGKLQSTDYEVSQANRKCIFAFIHQLTDSISSRLAVDDALRAQMEDEANR